MTQEVITSLKQGVDPSVLHKAMQEIQGLNVSVVGGEAAATKMNVAALRSEDTLIAVLPMDVTTGLTDDTANCTISATKATGTLTMSGDPVADETFVVNGVTYTWKAVPSLPTEVKISTGDDNAMAAAVASVVNAYEARKVNGNWNTAGVVASAASAVVTFTSVADGPGNGPVVTDVGTTITISNTNPAAVTATFVSAGDTDAVVVNGVTFTIKTVPVDPDLDMAVAADDTAQAVLLKNTVNQYEFKYGTLDVVVTNAAGVATISPLSSRKGNIITLTEASTNVAVSGSGFLAGGTNTGGFTSTTDLSAANLTVMVFWFNKS